MEVDNGQEQTTETPTTDVVETPAAASEGTGEPASPEASASAGQGGAVVPPPYQPNLTFRVRDPVSGRQVEKKFDDWIAAQIKDAETEKKVRELHERSHGLDAVKGDRERLFGEAQNLRQKVQEWQPTIDQVQQLVHFRDQKNLPAVFQLLGLDQREVFTWAYQFAQMTPEARQAAEQAAMQGMNAYGAQHQMSQAQQQALQQAQEFKQRELSMILRYDQGVSSAAAEFDQAHGQGAFLEQVARTGDYFWRQGRDVSVQDAVQEVMKLIGRGQQASPQAHMQQPFPGQGMAPQQPQGGVPQAPQKKPVIPSVQGTGTSPVKRVYRSMDDIKKRKQELEDMVG